MYLKGKNKNGLRTVVSVTPQLTGESLEVDNEMYLEVGYYFESGALYYVELIHEDDVEELGLEKA